MSKDALGNRMKIYEQAETGRRLMPYMPTCVRLDGRAFHSFTRGLERPYSLPLHNCMAQTAIELLKTTSATIAYTQSDEISLIFIPKGDMNTMFFNGNVHKLTSVIASTCTLQFYRYVEHYLGKQYTEKFPTFDCRVWQVPNEVEAANVLLWRELDATKNSISMAAQTYYRPGELHGKHQADQHEMLFQKGINWAHYPTWFKKGSYFTRVTRYDKFSEQEISSLPPKHQARTNPNFAFERSAIEELDIPPLLSIFNREDVLFRNASVLKYDDIGKDTKECAIAENNNVATLLGNL